MEFFQVDTWRVAVAGALSMAYISYSLFKYRSAQAFERIDPTSPKAGFGGVSLSSGATVSRQVMVVYASQTGQAESIAREAVKRLGSSLVHAMLRRLDQPWMDELSSVSDLLFVVSTYGEGSAPDHAFDFVRKHCASPRRVQLAGMRYGVLALGDSSYSQFCAFGRRLDAWLQDSGAFPLFQRIEADRLNAEGMDRWRRELSRIDAATFATPSFREECYVGHTATLAEPPENAFATWHFVRRRCLNVGSAGTPVYKVELAPVAGGLPQWEAGDLVDVIIPGLDSRPRTYSIASLPEDGILELIVRTCLREDGAVGVASTWLNLHAARDERLQLRIRPNPGFRLSVPVDTPLILIGSGAGMAGLRSHLKQRSHDIEAVKPTAGRIPERSAWLFFGERSGRYDRLCHTDIEDWIRRRVLSRVNLCFSRDNPISPYVQHALLAHKDEVRRWVEQGASILICGNARSMAKGVDAALREILGDAGVDTLLAERRILRDVF